MMLFWRTRWIGMTGKMLLLAGFLLLGLATLLPFKDAHALAVSINFDVNNAAPATRNLTYVDKDGHVKSCKDVKESKGGVMLGYLVPCLGATIHNATTKFSLKMIELVAPITQAFIVLVVLFFGVRLAQGGGNIRGDSFAFIFKIGIAFAIVNMVPNMITPAVYDSILEGQTMVSDALRAQDSSYGCNVGTYTSSHTPFLWAQMDCLLGKLYGFTTGTGANGEKVPNMLLASSAFGFLGGFLFGGSFGVILFFACIGMLWSFFVLIITIAKTFLTSYLNASLLLILSPLLVPTLMFKKTSHVFERWLSGIIASILMPVLITAYAIIAFLLYDQMLFAPNSKLKLLFDNDYVKQVQQIPRKPCDIRVGDGVVYDDKNNQNKVQDVGKNLLRYNFANPFMTGASDACGNFEMPTIDLTAVNSDGLSQKDQFTNLFFQVVQLLILSYLLQQGFRTCLDFIKHLTTSSSLANTVLSNPLESGFDDMKNKLIASFRQSDKEEEEARKKREEEDAALSPEAKAAKEMDLYKQRIVKAASSGLDGFMQGVRKK